SAGAAGAAGVTTVGPRPSESSLIAQRLHRREPAGLERRVRREHESERAVEKVRPEEALQVHVQRNADRRRDDLREADADDEPREAAESPQQAPLPQELLERHTTT